MSKPNFMKVQYINEMISPFLFNEKDEIPSEEKCEEMVEKCIKLLMKDRKKNTQKNTQKTMTLDDDMDIDTFITKLEEECGEKDMGYIKCLESVIHTHEQLKLSEENNEELEYEKEELVSKMEQMIDKKINEIKDKIEGIHEVHSIHDEDIDKHIEMVKEVKKNLQEHDILIDNELEELQEISSKQQEKIKELEDKVKDLEHICKKKTEGLKVCFPEYNPVFQGCDDKDMIVSMIKKMIVKYEDMIKKLTIGIVLCNNNSDFQEDIELTNPTSKKWKKGFNKEQVKIYETILKEMNDTDWNEDGGSCKLIYDKKDKTLGYEVIDSDDEELVEKWEEIEGFGFIEDETDDKWILKVKDLKTGKQQIFDRRKSKDGEFSVGVCSIGFKQIVIERGIDKVISDYTKLKKNKK